MGDYPNRLTSTSLSPLTADDKLNAGELTNYAIKFKTISFIPMASYFRVTVPTEFGFQVDPNPKCSFIPVDGNLISGNLLCTTEGSRVYIRGLKQDINPGTIMGLSLKVTNPNYAQPSPAWRIGILREKTQFVYDWKEDLYGDPILPGIISDIVLDAQMPNVNISRSKIVLLNLAFRIKNKINLGGAIKLTFPSSFSLIDKTFLGIPQTYYVTKGLQAISSTSAITLTFDEIANTLLITKFKEVEPLTVIEIALKMRVPSSSGATTPIILSTYTTEELLVKIDEDSKNIVAIVESIGSPITNSYFMTNPAAAGTGTTDLELSFQPSVDIAADSKMKISFPADLALDTPGATSCLKTLPSSTTTEAAPCSLAGNILVVTLDIGAGNQYSMGTGLVVSINGILKLPSIAKDYILDIKIEDSVAELVETYTETLIFESTDFTGISFTSMPKEKSTPAILILSFTIPFIVPEASIPTPSSSTSEIRIFFEPVGVTFVPRDLGYGTSEPLVISCRGTEGFEVLSGLNLECTLYPGLNPYIKVINYKEIEASKPLTIEFGGFSNPNGEFTILISVLKLESGIYQEISKGSSNIILDTTSAVAPVSVGLTKSDLQYSIGNSKVSQKFNLFFSLYLTELVDVDEYLIIKLPYYDIGFIRDPTAIVCRLNGVVKPCTSFNKVDWLKIKIDAQLTIGASISNFLTIENLEWPRYSKPNSEVYIMVLDSSKNTKKIYQYVAFRQAEPNSFEKFSITLDKTRRRQTNANYEFTFQTKNGIPDGASFVLSMPTQFSLLSSDPKIVIAYPDFKSSTSNTLRSYFSSSKVTVENIGAYPAKTDFRVQIKGARNPDTDTVLHDWKASIMMNNYLVDGQDKFEAFSLDPVYEPRTITINRISAFPDNSDVYADYYFSFTPRSALGAGARIQIFFPSQYKILPSVPYCVIWGALTTFESCQIDLTSIVIITDTPFSQGTINIRVDNIRNPGVGFTDSFEIQTQYDGEMVDQVDPNVKSGKNILISQKPPEIYLSEFIFDPMNEGESAEYRFVFAPPTKLTRTMEILLKFPQSFDKKIGNQVICYPIQNLGGNVKCRFEEKKIFVYNFNPITVTPDNPIILEVQGIINPNRVINGDAGFISVAVLESGATTFESYLAKAGVIEPTKAAGWTFFHGITTSNLLARSTSDYVFNLTCFDSIPAINAGGLVVIDLPIQFEIQDQSIGCSTPNVDYGTPSCEIISNKIFIKGNANPYSGQISFKIEKLKNPLEEIETGYFYIKTYDGFRKNIIERSFYTLDPFYNAYTFPGPVIKINNDEPIFVEGGTMSPKLYATVDQLSNLNLIIKPTSSPGISFVPYEMNLNIGENIVEFRVSVVEGFAEGDYYIEWSIFKDQIPPYFTSIKPLKITVTKKRAIPITISKINNIPFGGQSLPCMISLQNPPDTGVEITLKKKFDYKGIELDKTIVYFDSGVETASFSVFFSDTKAAAEENINVGQIEITLGGHNAMVYTLNEITLTFNIDPEDQTPPEITGLNLLSVSQHSCTVQFETNDVVVVYFMISLRGTDSPPLYEVRNQGPSPYLTTASRYGSIFVGATHKATVEFPGLTAGTEYIIYAYAEDRGGNVNSEPAFLIVKSSIQFRAAELTVQTNSQYLNPAEKEIIMRAIAFKLSLPLNKIREKQVEPLTRRRRNLEADKTSFTMYIIPVNDNPNYPDPAVLAQRVNQLESKAYIEGKFSTFDDTFENTIVSFPEYKPFFYGNSEIIDITYQSMTVRVGLSNYGTIFIVAIPQTEGTQTNFTH